MVSVAEQPAESDAPAACIKALSFDLDDTLWPVLPVLLTAEQALGDWLTQHAPATVAWLTAERRTGLRADIMARHPDHIWDMSWLRHRLLFEALEAAGEDTALADASFEVFLAARQQVTLYDDVRPMLTAWGERYPLIAISNGNADLNRIGLGHLFSVQVSAHLVGCAKPDPQIFRIACERAGVAPENVLHLGDDPELDYFGARRAGLQAAWVRRPDLVAARLAKGRPEPACNDPYTNEPIVALADLRGVDEQLSRIDRCH